MEATRSPRTYGFDVFRCLALAIVLAAHAFLYVFLIPGRVPWTPDVAFGMFLSTVSIDWFFVISGCLIGAMVIRAFERPGPWWACAKAFWVRRWFRTVPNYVLFLGVNVALVAWGLAPPNEPHWSYLAFSQNLVGQDEAHFFVESWSLAVEEWFYFLLPLLVGLGFLAFRHHPRRAILTAALVLVVVPPVIRWFAPQPADLYEWDMTFRRAVFMHLDAPGWGVLAAATSRWAPAAWARHRRPKLVAGALATVLGMAMMLQLDFGGVLQAAPRLSVALTFTFNGLGAYLALPWFAGLRSPTGALGRTFAALSDWSYSVYLAHTPLLFVLLAILPPGASAPTMVAALAAWVVAVVATSAAIFTWFERPISRLRERFAGKVDANPFHVPVPMASGPARGTSIEA